MEVGVRRSGGCHGAELAHRDAELAEPDIEVAGREEALIWQKKRIEQLEKALGDSHRRSKRQTAPFCKG